MENNNNKNQGQNMNSNPFQFRPAAPSSTAALVLGIVSLVTFFCYGIVGIVLGIIAIAQANKSIQASNENPGMYSESSIGNAKAGKIMGIIGIILGALVLLYVIFIFVLIGTMFSHLPWHEIR